MVLLQALVSSHVLAGFFGSVLLTFLICIVEEWLHQRKLRRQLVDVPVLNLKGRDFDTASREYKENLRGLLKTGYTQFKNGVYQLWRPDGYITVISKGFIDELKSLPTETLDFHAAVQTNFIGKYEWVTLGSNLLAHTILEDLTQQTSALLPIMADEIAKTFDEEMPGCKEFTPVTVYECLTRVAAILTGRVFVGAPLNRNEQWLDATIDFTHDVYIGGSKLRKWNYLLRPIVARFLVPEIRKVWKHQETARHFLVPIMEERSAAQKRPGYKKPNDLIQWLMDNAAKETKPTSFARLAELQLLASFAAIHTTSLTCTHVLFDLAARPEYIEPLREELDAVEARFGTLHTKQALSQLSRMDSFMKESQRLNPPGLLTFPRLVRKPITLSNGTLLPEGTQLIVPAGYISLDNEVWERADDFQGFRFADLRTARAEDGHKHQFVSTSPNAMHFGHGRRSCPGRFFAGHELKSILAYLLRTYDFKLAGGPDARRPANKEEMDLVNPDDKAQLLFRRRKACE
ncbi:Cytochrome P450 monooxygenase paxP [Lasiodiplodia theobromae]|uniref:Cytochrome P450 monooxygenase paxP n=1 Tax=Lasiodiplodia theobromae TaxID=45133 RepID=A0A5N5D786_9PEZI|nr:Cytochrome P450 monooxygenase paxP [Lasiodiplodia theobromae]